MKLEDAGIARDWREGTTLRASATVGGERDLTDATRITLINLVRQADEAGLTLDVTTIRSDPKRMQTPGTAHVRVMIISSAVAYP